MKTHIDLFSGIGGFALAAQWAGFQTEVFCEKDEFCQGVLRKHWPEVPIIPDIRDFEGSRWQGATLLTGGFPCQDLSNARFSSKMNLMGQQSNLFFQMARVANEARPGYILIENVPNVLKFQDKISRAIPGYHFYGAVANAEEFGVLCRRKRAFIIGHSGKGSAEKISNILKKHKKTFPSRGEKDILPMCLPWKGGPSLERLSSCLVENTKINPTRIREGDGIPRQLDGHRYLALGNAIVPQVAYEIIKGIVEIEKGKGGPR